MAKWKGCNFCKHKIKGKSTCKAFPKGIPFPIASGNLPHTSKMLGQQNNTVFEEVTPDNQK